MQPFLERLAELLLEHHRNELDRVAVVLPGKRAGLHLRKYLAQCSGTALWSPEVLDMGSFLQRTASLDTAQPALVQGGSLELLFLLYEAYQEITDTAEPFADFMEWGPTTLRDTSEVDSHLLDHSALYRDLTEYHELEEWSFRLGELSPGQQRLNKQWRSTGPLHTAHQELMRERGVATSGHIARRAAEFLGNNNAELPWKKVWFAGLNALDPASTKVIRTLLDRDLAHVAWDSDEHYLADVRQEAGRYLRRSIKDLGPGLVPPLKGILQQQRTVRNVAVPNGYAQTTYVAQRLAALTIEERAATAVVLAQEDLLLPLLQQMPADIGPLNVTMGIPLKSLPVHGLTEAFLALHAAQRDDGSMMLVDLERLWGHPFLNEGSSTTRSFQELRALGTMRVDLKDVIAIATANRSAYIVEMSTSLDPIGEATDLLPGRYNALFNWAKKNASKDRSIQEQLFQMARLQQRLDHALHRSGLPSLDLRTYALIRQKLLREESITFLGEPLRGLQLMGVLETRALDHERLIMLSMNEGVFPKNTATQSWIPFPLRKHYKLPLSSDAEAISAYHFNRAMQKTRTVELVHSNSDDAEGEPSRFLAQWKHEVVGKDLPQPDKVGGTTWTEHVVSAPAKVRDERPLIVQKDAAVMERLRTLCEKGLSPSALGTWLACPLDFYFKYGLGIRETDVADGTLGSDVLGDAVHHVLQTLFTPFLGKELTPEDIAGMIPMVDQVLTDRLAEQIPRDTLSHGHIRLRREMAGHALRSYLGAEQDRCKTERTELVAVELEVKGTLPNGVMLKGRCDRIDLRNGIYTLLDVKTGSVRSEDLRIPSLVREELDKPKRFALQLLIYAWAYMEQHPSVAELVAGVLPLQRPTLAQGEFLKVAKEEVIRRGQLEPIADLLNALVNELLDPDVPFAHDPKSLYCVCCVG